MGTISPQALQASLEALKAAYEAVPKEEKPDEPRVMGFRVPVVSLPENMDYAQNKSEVDHLQQCLDSCNAKRNALGGEGEEFFVAHDRLLLKATSLLNAYKPSKAAYEAQKIEAEGARKHEARAVEPPLPGPGGKGKEPPHLICNHHSVLDTESRTRSL